MRTDAREPQETQPAARWNKLLVDRPVLLALRHRNLCKEFSHEQAETDWMGSETMAMDDTLCAYFKHLSRFVRHQIT